MFNKEALNEIRETIYNLIKPNIGANIRTVTGFHNQSVIRVDFVSTFSDSTETVVAVINYNGQPIGRLNIDQSDTIDEMKSKFLKDFDKQWPGFEDTMLDNYIKQLGLANNICSALANGKDTVIEGMGGVKATLQFTKPFQDQFGEAGTDETYFDITIVYNETVMFSLYDKYDPLKAMPLAGGVGAKMNALVKRAFLVA